MKKLITVFGAAIWGISTAFAQFHPDIPYAEVQTINPQPIPNQGGLLVPAQQPKVKAQPKQSQPKAVKAVKKPVKKGQVKKQARKVSKKPAVVCPKYFGLHYDKLGRPYCTPIKANKRK